MRARARAIVIGVVSGLFIAACVFPTYQGVMMGDDADLIGLQVLVLGPFLFTPIWIANLTLAQTLWWLRQQRYFGAGLASAFGIVLAAVPLGVMFRPFPGQLGAGYFLWLSSMVTAAIGVFICARLNRSQSAVPSGGQHK